MPIPSFPRAVEPHTPRLVSSSLLLSRSPPPRPLLPLHQRRLSSSSSYESHRILPRVVFSSNGRVTGRRTPSGFSPDEVGLGHAAAGGKAVRRCGARASQPVVSPHDLRQKWIHNQGLPWQGTWRWCWRRKMRSGRNRAYWQWLE